LTFGFLDFLFDLALFNKKKIRQILYFFENYVIIMRTNPTLTLTTSAPPLPALIAACSRRQARLMSRPHPTCPTPTIGLP
jgi:hypothetical protein